MSLEIISVAATIGTFVVITASAIAALVQLRHMSGSNQISALNELRETMESPGMSEAQRFVWFELPRLLRDPEERNKVASLPLTGEYEKVGTIANVFESMGEFVKLGIIDRRIACEIWAYVAVRNWESLAPLITYLRHTLPEPSLWENFEYFAMLSKRFKDRHPDGTYPAQVPRMPEDRSLLDALNSTRTESHDTAGE